MILFQNILFLREFLACNGYFGLFNKIKKGAGTSFWFTSSEWLFHKNAPCLIPYQWAKFQCHIFFPSQDIKPDVWSSSYFDSWWRYKLYDYLPSTSIAMADGEKEGKTETQKSQYLENVKRFLDEIKNIFHSFWRAII